MQDKLVSFVLSSAVGCLTVVLLLAAAPPLQACDDGWTVPDPENNSGLVEDCRVLLALRDDLAGTGFLNWEFGVPIDRWGGIRVSGSPSRVRQLVLFGDDLSGSIPSGLGRLSQLQTLRLSSRQLMGPIPPELGTTVESGGVEPLWRPAGNDSCRVGSAPPASVGWHSSAIS